MRQIGVLHELDIYPGIRQEVSLSLAHQFELPEQKAIVLTDDYNPIDFFDAGAREEARLAILRSAEPELLVN